MVNKSTPTNTPLVDSAITTEDKGQTQFKVWRNHLDAEMPIYLNKRKFLAFVLDQNDISQRKFSEFVLGEKPSFMFGCLNSSDEKNYAFKPDVAKRLKPLFANKPYSDPEFWQNEIPDEGAFTKKEVQAYMGNMVKLENITEIPIINKAKLPENVMGYRPRGSIANDWHPNMTEMEERKLLFKGSGRDAPNAQNVPVPTVDKKDARITLMQDRDVTLNYLT